MTIQIRKLSFLTNEPVYQNVPDVKRTQEILLFFVLVVLAIYVICFGVIICLLSINYRTSTYEPILMLYWISFYAVGLFITKTYSPKGLYIFGWLGILNIILSCTLSVLASVGIIIITSQSPKLFSEITFITIPMAISLTNIILKIIIVIYSFKLWYLIRKHEHLNKHQQINIQRL